MASGPRNPQEWAGPPLASSILLTSCLRLWEAFQGWREGAAPSAPLHVGSPALRKDVHPACCPFPHFLSPLILGQAFRLRIEPLPRNFFCKFW